MEILNKPMDLMKGGVTFGDILCGVDVKCNKPVGSGC